MKLDQLSYRHDAATNRMNSCVAQSSLRIAPLLKELYISENSDIETKDKLYVILEMLRKKEKEIMTLLNVENEEISNQIRSAIDDISNL